MKTGSVENRRFHLYHPSLAMLSACIILFITGICQSFAQVTLFRYEDLDKARMVNDDRVVIIQAGSGTGRPETFIDPQTRGKNFDIPSSYRPEGKTTAKPPVAIRVRYAKDGFFSPYISKVIGDAILEVSIDGAVALRSEISAAQQKKPLPVAWRPDIKQADVNKYFPVPISRGEHTVTIRNAKDRTGLTIPKIVLKNYGPPVNYLTDFSWSGEKTIEIKCAAGVENKFTVRMFFLNSIVGSVFLDNDYLSSVGGKINDSSDCMASYTMYGTPQKATARLRFSFSKLMNVETEEPAVLLCEIKSEVGTVPPIPQANEIRHRIRLSRNGRYFIKENNEYFFPIGQSLVLTGNRADAQTNDFIHWYNPSPDAAPKTIAWIRHMSRYGINHLRLMWYTDYFEKELGEYNPETVKIMDDILETCRACGIYIEISPVDHFPTALYKTAYRDLIRQSKFKGHHGFFDSTAVRPWIKKQIDFFNSRYRDNPAFFAFEPYTEIHGGDADTEEDFRTSIHSYFNEISGYSKELRPDILTDASLNKPYEGDFKILSTSLLGIKTMDFASPHLYGWDENIHSASVTALANEYGKPVIVGECSTFINPDEFRNACFAMIFSGIAGIRTWNSPEYLTTESHLLVHAAVGTIVNSIEWDLFTKPVYNGILGVPPKEMLAASGKVRYIIDEAGTAALIWVEGSGSPFVELPRFAGTCSVRWYDPETGRVMGEYETDLHKNKKITLSKTNNAGKYILYLIKKT